MNAHPRTLSLVTSDAMRLRSPGPDGFTVADLHALPDDGLRYELIDGSIVVSPSATISHNTIARWLVNDLEAGNPRRGWVASTDQSTTVDDHNEPRPDLVVARIERMDETPFPIGDTALVGEIVSPTSVLRDTETKRALYARAGVPAYWIVVPDKDKRQITLAELRIHRGEYTYAVHYTSDVFTTDHPWPVTIDLPGLSRLWDDMFNLTRYRDGG